MHMNNGAPYFGITGKPEGKWTGIILIIIFLLYLLFIE